MMAGSPDHQAGPMDRWLDARAADRQKQHLARHRRVLSGHHPVEIQSGETPLLNFSSNDYLGLASHPDLVKALKDAADG